MQFSKYSSILVFAMISIMLIGAVSAESIDDSNTAPVLEDFEDIHESVESSDTSDLNYENNGENNVGDSSILNEEIDYADLEENDLEDSELEENIYDLDDSNFEDYFNYDGTPKDILRNGDYTLRIGTLNNRFVKIESGSNILITAKENGGMLKNTAIVIGGSESVVSSVTVSGLTFIHNNYGVSIVGSARDIVIDNNKFNMTYSGYFEGLAIVCHEVIDGIQITNNEILVNSSKGSTSAIAFKSQASNLLISDNVIDVTANKAFGYVKAIALDSLSNAIIETNDITLKTTNDPIVSHGIYVADSRFNDPSIPSPNNIIIQGNKLVLDTEDIAYGIAINSLGDSITSKNISILDNIIDIDSETGAIGIATQSSDVTVRGNELSIVTKSPGSVNQYYYDEDFGKESYLILNKNYNETGNLFFNNVTITGNVIETLGLTINSTKTEEEDSRVAPLTVESNCFLVNEETYPYYFDENGYLKEGTIDPKDILLFDDMAGKNLYFNVPAGIKSAPGTKLTNSTINLLEGADGTRIIGLNIDYEDDTGGEIDIININGGLSDILIANSTINASASLITKPIYINASTNVSIDGNRIYSHSIDGEAYGIDSCQNNNITFANNEIEVLSDRNMAYGISSISSNGVVLEANEIKSIGIGAVGLGLLNDENVEIWHNDIEIVGGDFTTISSTEPLSTANAAILNKDESSRILKSEDNRLIENGRQTHIVKTGNGTKDLQNILDDADAGDVIDLTGQYFADVGTVTIDKDITIMGGKIIGAESSVIFEIAQESQGSISEVNITAVNILVSNADIIVKAVALNASSLASIDVPAINIQGNLIETANENVVSESITILELDSERPILSPINEITIIGNTIDAGIDPFEFKVTSVASGDDINVVPQNISLEKKATAIEYNDMITTAVDIDTDGRVGEYFKVVLKDADGNVLAGKAVQIGFNGKIYNRTTDKNGACELQINLVRSDIYTFAVSFIGDDVYNGSFVVAKITVNKQKGSLNVPAKSYAASAKTKSLTATFKAASGKVVAGKSITFTVNGKTYSATTNSKGVATVKVSLNKKGTYSFTAKFAGDSTYAAISKSAKLTIK